MHAPFLSCWVRQVSFLFPRHRPSFLGPAPPLLEGSCLQPFSIRLCVRRVCKSYYTSPFRALDSHFRSLPHPLLVLHMTSDGPASSLMMVMPRIRGPHWPGAVRSAGGCYLHITRMPFSCSSFPHLHPPSRCLAFLSPLSVSQGPGRCLVSPPRFSAALFLCCPSPDARTPLCKRRQQCGKSAQPDRGVLS